jgi:photosystem II stability/assembly factor-like uncharacterized protein
MARAQRLLTTVAVAVLFAACVRAPEPTPAASGSPPAGPAASPTPIADLPTDSAAPTPLPPGPDVVLADRFDHGGWVLTTTGLYLTVDEGATWRSAVVPGPVTGRGVLGMDFADAAHGWIATLDGPNPLATDFDVWRTTDGGRTWARAVVPEGANRSDTMGPVEFYELDPGHLFLFVGGGMPDGYVSDLYESRDGGRTWLPDRVTPDAGVTGPIAFADPTHGVVSGGAPGSRLFSTDDSGRTWTRTAIPPLAGTDPQFTDIFNPARFWDARAGGLAVTYGTDQSATNLGMLVTADGGSTWSLAATIPLAPPMSNDIVVAFVSRSEWTLVPDADTVMHTIDGGRTWTASPSVGLPGSPTELFMTDAERGWALVQLNVCLTFKSDCHSRTAPYATTDGGASWSALTPG